MRWTRPRGGAAELRGEPRGRAGGDQAAAGLSSLCLLLAACEIPKEVNPVYIYREVTGLSDEGRLPPPGLDQPFPNLAVVPPRPERPPLALREAISPRPALARAPAVPWTERAPGTAAPRDGRAPDRAAPPAEPAAAGPAAAVPGLPVAPTAPPPPPPPDLLGPAPGAPPPPPPADLLAPPRLR